jgi:hypothetical protein
VLDIHEGEGREVRVCALKLMLTFLPGGGAAGSEAGGDGVGDMVTRSSALSSAAWASASGGCSLGMA